MPDNPYTRELTVTLLELVPFRDNLPDCHALLADGRTRCGYKAKHIMNDRPLCGIHCRPGVMFFPERMIPIEERLPVRLREVAGRK
jgi:hypothetical protein